MGDNDDPFGLQNDAGRTRIRPVNRPQRVMTGRPGSQSAARVETAPVYIRQARSGDNALVSAFSVLLGLAPELERATQPENPDVLNTRFYDNLIYSRDAAVSGGVPLARADQAAWFVAATLDDIVLNTPWGAASAWPSNPLVTKLSGEVNAGERYFELLDQLMRYPDRDPDLLELAYYGLSLGFRGRYRVQGASGEAAITQLRMQISRILSDNDAEILSPRWRGVEAPDEPPRFIIPIWSIPVFAVSLLALLYAGLGFGLSTRAERLNGLALALPPGEQASIFREPIEAAPVVEEVELPRPIEEIVAPPPLIELVPLVQANAPPALVPALDMSEDASRALVSIQADSPELFRSARADVNDIYDPLLTSIAAVLVENLDMIAGVTVVGHTDSIQSSNPLRSNQVLSEERAATVAAALVSAGFPAELITPDGRAATEPIADNGTPEGRARNRRVEIYIHKRV
ncbi:MAG: type IVB secretion system protein IcmH/DotU [Pseudomonadota bacterium]